MTSIYIYEFDVNKCLNISFKKNVNQGLISYDNYDVLFKWKESRISQYKHYLKPNILEFHIEIVVGCIYHFVFEDMLA